jgi:hypothetical protein
LRSFIHHSSNFVFHGLDLKPGIPRELGHQTISYTFQGVAKKGPSYTLWFQKKYMGSDCNHLNDRVNIASGFDMINGRT